MSVNADPLAGTAKLRELILHFCLISEADESFGSIKLNKLLFYTDFAAYRTFGKSVTEQQYQKLDKGPAPRLLLPLRNNMIKRKELVLADRDYYGRPQKRPIALRPAILSSFSPEEVDLADRVVRLFQATNGKEISDISHEFPGWRLALEGEIIPYSVALLDQRELTAKEKAWAHEIDMTGITEMIAS